MPLNAGFYQQRLVLFDGSSAQSSTLTSSSYYIGDYEIMSMQWLGNSSSVCTLRGSNDDGFTAAIANWSTVTALITNGVYTIDPGIRWVSATRNSSISTSALVIQGRT